RTLPMSKTGARDRCAFGDLLLREAGEAARCAQHAAGNFDDRHVDIFYVQLIHVNVSIFYRRWFVRVDKPGLSLSVRCAKPRAACPQSINSAIPRRSRRTSDTGATTRQHTVPRA